MNLWKMYKYIHSGESYVVNFLVFAEANILLFIQYIFYLSKSKTFLSVEKEVKQ